MKAFVTAFLFTALLVPAGAQKIFESIESARRLELADAYYEAGKRFQELGQKERGAQFIAKASVIFPGYDPSMQKPQADVETVLPEITLEGPIDPLTGIPDRPSVREENIDGERIVRFQFTKLIRGFLSGDAKVISSSVGDNLAGPGFEQGLSNQEVTAAAQEFFDKNTYFTRWSASRLFDMSSLALNPVQETPDYILSISTNPETFTELMTLLPFWGEKVSFYFIRKGDNWFLAGVVPN